MAVQTRRPVEGFVLHSRSSMRLRRVQTRNHLCFVFCDSFIVQFNNWLNSIWNSVSFCWDYLGDLSLSPAESSQRDQQQIPGGKPLLIDIYLSVSCSVQIYPRSGESAHPCWKGKSRSGGEEEGPHRDREQLGWLVLVQLIAQEIFFVFKSHVWIIATVVSAALFLLAAQWIAGSATATQCASKQKVCDVVTTDTRRAELKIGKLSSFVQFIHQR